MQLSLELIEVYNNLKNYDFEVNGNYKMDESEAKKIIKYVENVKKGAKNENN